MNFCFEISVGTLYNVLGLNMKKSLAFFTPVQVDRYLRRLDQELQKFKMELEADNAGITEVLEKRSLELDNPPVGQKPESRFMIFSLINHAHLCFTFFIG